MKFNLIMFAEVLVIFVTLLLAFVLKDLGWAGLNFIVWNRLIARFVEGISN